MLFIAACVCFVACIYGAPAPTDVVPLEKQQPTVIPIVSQSDELEPNGTYHFSYETGNGIKREEISYDKKVPRPEGRSADSNEGGEDSGSDSDEIHVQIGSYSYTAPDGTLISVRYTADENGFQPIGDHIPRVPSAPGSGEKSGRALKPADNKDSAAAPKAALKSAEKPKDAAASLSSTAEPKPAESSEKTSTASSGGGEDTTKAADETSSTEVSKASEEASTTESFQASTTEAASTSEAAKTTGVPSKPAGDASTPAGDASTPAGDASTPAIAASDVTTPAGVSSTTSIASSADQSTSNAEPSTTEAASPSTTAV